MTRQNDKRDCWRRRVSHLNTGDSARSSRGTKVIWANFHAFARERMGRHVLLATGTSDCVMSGSRSITRCTLSSSSELRYKILEIFASLHERDNNYRTPDESADELATCMRDDLFGLSTVDAAALLFIDDDSGAEEPPAAADNGGT